MSPWLRWTLLGTLGLSGWAILFPAEVTRAPGRTAAPQPVDPVAPVLVLPPLPSVPAGPAVPSGMLAALPADLPQPRLEAAVGDPFVGVQPAPPPPPPPPVAVVAMPVVPPAPPALNYRYLGRVVDPDGKLLVYLGGADKEQLVAKGTQLAEGYVVQAITATAIELYYPPLDYRAQIRIPPDEAP